MNYTLEDYEKEIIIRRRMIQLAEKRKEELVLKLGPRGYGGRSYVDADNIHGTASATMEEIVERISQLDNEIYIHKCVIEFNKTMIEEIKDYINTLSGLKCKVKNMQMVEGKTLKEISDELGYSYDYIREVAVKKE